MDSKKKKSKLIDLGERGRYSPNNKMNELTGKEWVKFTKSWGIVNPKRRKEGTLLHPAKYPEELVKEFISFFTKEGDIVFDPFLGTGSTLVASMESGRKGIGIELSEKYAKISRERVENELDCTQFVINEDSNKIDGPTGENIQKILSKLESDSIDYIITSPPYWDMLKKSRGNIISAQKNHIKKGGDEYYSDKKEDLGNLKSYEEYMENLVAIFEKMHYLLKNKGYLTVVIQNIRVSEGNMIPVAWDLAMRLSKKYVLKQEKLWLQDNKRLNCWGYPSTYVSNVHHHYCLVFQKC